MKSDLQVPHLLWGALAFLIASGPCSLHASDAAPAVPQDKWLRTAKAQVLISVYPSLRISALSEPGAPTLLTGSADGLQSDVRFIALELEDDRQTYLPFDQPARWISHDERSAIIETFTEVSGRSFKLMVSLTLSETKSSLAIQCALIPKEPSPKPLALWAIASLAPRGWIVTTLSRGFEKQQMIPGQLVTYWKTPLNAPALHLDDDILAVDLSHWEQDLKYGTRSNAGWIAAIDLDKQTMLTATFPYEAEDTYPDGNCNATIYLGLHALGGRYAEMEWLSPWTNVPAGQELTWSFSLESRPYPKENAPPSPRRLKKAVIGPERKTPANTMSSTPGRWTISTQSPQTRDYFGRVTQWFAPGGRGEMVLASAPYWKNAPIWSDADGSFQLDKDTFIETNPDTLVPWSNEDRSWEIEFSVTKPMNPGKRILLQDGDSQAGICLFIEGSLVTAAAWSMNPQLLSTKLSTSIPFDARCLVRLKLSHREKTISLEVDGNSPSSTTIPFGLEPMNANLVIGRPSVLPPTPVFSGLQPFIGKIFQTTVSQPVLP